MTSLRHQLASPLLGLHRLIGAFRRRPPGAVRILLLHGVAPAEMPALAQVLDSIAAGDGFVTPAEAEARLDPAFAPDGRAPTLVTFDDGFSSNLTAAQEILPRHNVKAVFFICPGLMDLAPADQPGAVARHMFRGATSVLDLPPAPVLMGWEDVAGLSAMGHVIGAHGLTHRNLARLGTAELLVEVNESGDRIKARLGRPVEWFAYPFGDIESLSAKAMGVIAARFRLCRSGVRGLNASGTDSFALLAQQVDLLAPPAYRSLALEGGLDLPYRDARIRLAAIAQAARVGKAQ